MQDFMRLYSGLVERCFTSCCNDFTSKTLSSKEVRRSRYFHRSVSNATAHLGIVFTLFCCRQEQCVSNCTDKFLKYSERVGARFAEHNAGTFPVWAGFFFIVVSAVLTCVLRLI